MKRHEMKEVSDLKINTSSSAHVIPSEIDLNITKH